MNWKFWQRSKPFKAFILNEKYRVEPAFTVGGIDYYQFNDAFEIPSDRALATLVIYEEFDMRCTKEYLEKHIKATEIILSGASGKIDLNDLRLINNNLKERLSLVAMPDYIYKLASVLFFDKNESPYSYNREYNDKKIARWKADPATLDFFLTQPFKKLMPSLNLDKANARTFFKVAQKADQQMLEDLDTIISSKG